MRKLKIIENKISSSIIFDLASDLGVIISFTTFQYLDSLIASSIILPFACLVSVGICVVTLFLRDLYFFNAIYLSPEVELISFLA